MRAIKLFLTASGFVAFFIVMVGLSALTTSAAHWAFSPRAVPLSIVQD
jgi:hypothetical protein